MRRFIAIAFCALVLVVCQVDAQIIVRRGALASAGGGALSTAFVQKKPCTNTFASTCVVAMDATPTNGNCLLATGSVNNSATITSFSSSNATWAQLTSQTVVAGTVMEVWKGTLTGTPANANITLTASGSFFGAAFNVSEYSGAACTVDDTLVANTNTGTANATLGTFSSSTAGEVVYSVAVTDSGTWFGIPSSPWTSLGTIAGPPTINDEYIVNASTGSKTATWVNNFSSDHWATAVVSVK